MRWAVSLQARIWMQCMGDLRTGVKLKKVNLSKTPIEFELTPYEILMDDIRARNYKLRKVEVPEEGRGDGGKVRFAVKHNSHECYAFFIGLCNLIFVQIYLQL